MSTTVTQSKFFLVAPNDDADQTIGPFALDDPMVAGNTMIVVIDCQNSTQAPSYFEGREPAPFMANSDGLAGFGKEEVFADDRRSISVLCGPAQPSIEDYLQFHPNNSGSLDADADISVWIYEVHSSLGPVLGYPAVASNSAYTTSIAQLNVPPFPSAATGYNKSGPMVALAIGNPGDDAGPVISQAGRDFNAVGTAGAPGHVWLGVTERPQENDTIAFDPEDNPDGWSGSIVGLVDLVPQSQFAQRQRIWGNSSAVQFEDAPLEGSAIIVAAHSESPLTIDPEWDDSKTSVSSNGTTRITVMYRRAGADETGSISIPGALSIYAQEATGFAHGPTIQKYVTGNENTQAQTTMPQSVPGDDAYFYAAMAFNSEIDAWFLLPELAVVVGADPTPSVIAAGEGWDFYPDEGTDVLVIGGGGVQNGGEEDQPSAAAIFGALFIDDPDYTTDPEPEVPEGAYTFPDRGQQLAYLPGQRRGTALASAKGVEVRVYSDPAGTTLAAITNLEGDAITGSLLAVDESSLIPRFLGPTGVKKLYVRVAGDSHVMPIDADFSEQISHGGGGSGADLLTTANTWQEDQTFSGGEIEMDAGEGGIALFDIPLKVVSEDQEDGRFTSAVAIPKGDFTQFIGPMLILSKGTSISDIVGDTDANPALYFALGGDSADQPLFQIGASGDGVPNQILAVQHAEGDPDFPVAVFFSIPAGKQYGVSSADFDWEFVTKLYVDNLIGSLPLLETNHQTASYTLQLSDLAKAVEFESSSPMTVTVPAGVFPAGAEVNIYQVDSGSIEAVTTDGINFVAPDGKKTAGPGKMMTLWFRTTNDCVVSGGVVP